MDLHQEMIQMGAQALKAGRELVRLSTRKKNVILEAMAGEIDQQRELIKAANDVDLEAAKAGGLSAAMIDRLALTDARIDAVIKGLQNVAALKDPVGSEIKSWMRPNGLEIKKMRVPIGVIGIIFESRPNVTADAAALCLKTSNATILRGGKEALHSNRAIAKAMIEGGAKKGMPEHAVQLVQTTDREAVRELCQLVGMVDLIIPRGGAGLIKAVTEMAYVPVIKHDKGLCHVYVDASADLKNAVAICENAKCQRPGVCNAIETILVHEAVAAEFVPMLMERLRAFDVEVRGDAVIQALAEDIKPATEEDWSTEYLDMIVSVKAVSDVDEAIMHINHFGSHHSDAIVTKDESAEKAFLQQVDSSTVYVNASTRFTDGAEFGLGAEIGISTDKLHARGPMGLEELTTYKFMVMGSGQIRD